MKNALGESFYFLLGQGDEPFEGARQVLEGVSPGFLAQVSRKMNKLIEEVKFADNALISAEVGMFTIMDSCLDIEQWLRRLEALERGEETSNLLPSSKGTAASRPAARPLPQKKVSSSKKTAAAASAQPADPVSSSAAVTKEAPAATPAANTLTNQQLWQKMLQHFESSPFVYDVMLNCAVSFQENKWTLSFAAEKAFYQIPAQSKLADLEAAAWQLGGRRVTIQLAAEPTPAAAAVASSPAKKKKEAPVILDEEPISTADFSAEIAAPSSPAEAPEEIKDVLEVISGELLA